MECGEACKIREAEAHAAAKILGISEIDFLRQPDWTLGEHVGGAAAMLAPVILRERPQVIYVPHPDEWHPDHKATNAILEEVLAASNLKQIEVRGYEVWTPC